MGFVFISYSRRDKDYISELNTALNQRGIEYWVDEHIDYATEWPKIIQKQLDACSALIVLMSSRSYDSTWVQNELAWAINEKKPIYPLLLEGKPWLSVITIQWEDVTHGALPSERFFDKLKTINQAQPGSTAPASVPPDAAGYILRGKQHRKQGEYSLALSDFIDAMRLDPANPEGYSGAGFINFIEGNHLEALRLFTRSIELDPTQARIHYSRGLVYSILPDYPAALADFSKAIQLDPDYPSAKIARSLVYDKLGLSAEAEADRQSIGSLKGH